MFACLKLHHITTETPIRKILKSRILLQKKFNFCLPTIKNLNNQNLLLLPIVFFLGFNFLNSYSQSTELISELIEEGKFADAIKILDKIVEEDPNNVQAIYLRGQLYAQLGEFEEAIRNYDIALSLTPGNEDILKAKSYVEGLSTPIQLYYLETIFYGREIVADGDDSEWVEIRSKSKSFEGFNVDVASSSKLSGQILLQNNENNLGILLKLHTPVPMKGNEHSILIAFDENGDGSLVASDNVL